MLTNIPNIKYFRYIIDIHVDKKKKKKKIGIIKNENQV